MIKKIFVLVLMLVMSFALSSCKKQPPYKLDSVEVSIKYKYYSNVAAEIYTIESFDYDNIKEIEYIKVQSRDSDYIRIHLKKTGKKQVQDAIDHLTTLEFVKSAYPTAIRYGA